MSNVAVYMSYFWLSGMNDSPIVLLTLTQDATHKTAEQIVETAANLEKIFILEIVIKTVIRIYVGIVLIRTGVVLQNRFGQTFAVFDKTLIYVLGTENDAV